MWNSRHRECEVSVGNIRHVAFVVSDLRSTYFPASWTAIWLDRTNFNNFQCGSKFRLCSTIAKTVLAWQTKVHFGNHGDLPSKRLAQGTIVTQSLWSRIWHSPRHLWSIPQFILSANAARWNHTRAAPMTRKSSSKPAFQKYPSLSRKPTVQASPRKPGFKHIAAMNQWF
jgi:hypothetical protein